MVYTGYLLIYLAVCFIGNFSGRPEKAAHRSRQLYSWATSPEAPGEPVRCWFGCHAGSREQTEPEVQATKVSKCSEFQAVLLPSRCCSLDSFLRSSIFWLECQAGLNHRMPFPDLTGRTSARCVANGPTYKLFCHQQHPRGSAVQTAGAMRSVRPPSLKDAGPGSGRRWGRLRAVMQGDICARRKEGAPPTPAGREEAQARLPGAFE